jgi:uroporphyrinogen decarboxylase
MPRISLPLSETGQNHCKFIISNYQEPLVNPRKNTLAAMRRQNPDHVPFILGMTAPVYEIFKEKTGADDPSEYWDFDMRGIGFHSPIERLDFGKYLPNELPEGAVIDEWGIASVPGSMYHFTKMVHPLRDASTEDDIHSYPLPDYTRKECWQAIETDTAAYQQRGYAVAGQLEITIFEISWYIRGMENLMHDMLQNPFMAEALLDRITRLRVFQARTFAKFGVDVLALGDDISMQTGMLMSPRMWRRWFKPRLAEVIQEAKAVKPDLLVQYHSDGDCHAVIPELIEIGVDILNPVQPECMDPVMIKNQYGNRLSFSGTIGTQTTMPYGTPVDVRAAVKHMVDTVGQGGGLLLAPTHVIEPDVPWENIIAFVEACREFGKY